jgi:hypothetical protein
VRGDTGLPIDPLPATDEAWDGALGYLVNAVEWAGGGNGLNIVSWYDGEFPGSYWWLNSNSFLRTELTGYLSSPRTRRDNTPWISNELAGLQLNYGLSSTGLSNWTWSFHSGFSLNTLGYSPSILDDADNPQWALSIYRDTAPSISPQSQPVPIPFITNLISALFLALIARVATRYKA